VKKAILTQIRQSTGRFHKPKTEAMYSQKNYFFLVLAGSLTSLTTVNRSYVSLPQSINTKNNYHSFMKKNHKNVILCSLLSLAFMQTQSQAALIPVTPVTGDANISATVNATNSGANTVTATGGTNPVVTLQTGALLTGDAAAGVNQFIGINITAAGYTITNDGSITASNDAIRSNNAAIINNNLGGVLSGTGASSQGIDMAGGATAAISNSGTISGLLDAISITSATVLITNTTTGVIQGLTNAASDGISAQASATVNNSNIIRGQGNGIVATTGLTVTNLLTTSTITGNVNGISATTGALITNNTGASITGTTGTGVTLTGGSVINTGTIRGGADGVLANGAAVIIENNINGRFKPFYIMLYAINMWISCIVIAIFVIN
jgi:hypothetical protein